MLTIKSLGLLTSVHTKEGARARNAMGSHMSGTKMRKIGPPCGHPQPPSKVKEKMFFRIEKAPNFLLENNAVTS